YPPTNDVAIDHHVSIPMRDGVVLYADVYRPIKNYKYPVLVSRRLIARSDIPALTRSLYFSPAGVTFTCFRTCEDGTNPKANGNRSEMISRMAMTTVEWAARQPWSNGKVGMQGHSYGGHVQWHAAMARPPHLVTIFPMVAST